MNARDAVARWIDVYTAAWRSGELSRLEEIFAPDARTRSAPFRPSESALQYHRRVLMTDRARDARFGLPLVDGDRAAVEYWASFTDNGEEVTIAGFVILWFGPDGRCLDSRDYWQLEKGRHEPATNWGR